MSNNNINISKHISVFGWNFLKGQVVIPNNWFIQVEFTEKERISTYPLFCESLGYSVEQFMKEIKNQLNSSFIEL